MDKMAGRGGLLCAISVLPVIKNKINKEND